MGTRVTRSILFAVAALGGLGLPGTAEARRHRLVLPPPTFPLATSLAVDEKEYSLTPSQRMVAAGTIKIRVYNRGMDDHDLTVISAAGIEYQVPVPAGGNATLLPKLTPGKYTLYCSLFNHASLGMTFDLEVR
jgi:plastocyanin